MYLLNRVPAFMPPTWSVLAVLHLTLGLAALPLAICAAFSATAGRLTLALASRRYGRRLLKPARRDELAMLGQWLDTKARWAAPLAMLLYSFGPIPSNQLFIAAGLTRMALGKIVGAFLAGRLVSYPLWVGAAAVAASRLEELFVGRITSGTVVVIELGLITSVVLFTRVDWTRLIARFDPAFAARRAALNARV